MLKKHYEIIGDGPRPIEWDEYCKVVVKEYNDLLCSESFEKDFQKFFEENPSFIPGASKIFGKSGHGPFLGTLISQPEIGAIFRRKPDFVWLAQDSLNFSPVFVEIERPTKRMFNKDQTTTAAFNQALGQIHQWKCILNNSTNIQVLKESFALPTSICAKAFKPQFLLIYGRRSEYENNSSLMNLRASYCTNDTEIISYDRLQPQHNSRHMVTCNVCNGIYNIVSIPPTYEYSPDRAEELANLNGFKDEIKNMKRTSDERKNFLSERYEYWYNFGEMPEKGVLCSSDTE